MPRNRHNPQALVEKRAASPRRDWLGTAALVVLLAAGAARITMLETLREPLDVAVGGMSAPRGAGPATAIALDLLCCVPAILVLLRRCFNQDRAIRLGWWQAPLGALAAWMFLSQTWAADRFAAMVGAANFVAAAAMLWAAAQLVRTWLHVRIVAGTVLGILLVYVAAGLEYRLADLPSFQERWVKSERQITMERHGWKEGDQALREYEATAVGQDPAARKRWTTSLRQSMLDERNWRESDPMFQRYEQKALAGETLLFASSPNTTAAVMLLAGAITLGLIIQRRLNGDSPGWLVLPLVILAIAAYVGYFTYSRAAAVLAFAGIGLFIAVGLLRSWLAAHHRAVFVGAVVAFTLGWIALIGHGLAHGNLPDASLTVRWYYWTGAVKLLAHNPLRGIGWGSFGDCYLAVRQALATEEVKDPHNFLVRSFVELGLVGGALAVGWTVLTWWKLTRSAPDMSPEELPARRPAVAILSIAILAMLINALATIDFDQATGSFFSQLVSADVSPENAYVISEVFRRIAGALAMIVGLLIATLRVSGSRRELALDDRPAPWVVYAMTIGLGLFFVHNLIDVAMFEPSGMFLLAIVAGIALAARGSASPTSMSRRWIIAATCTACILWLVAIPAIYLPTAEAESAAAAGDAAMRAGRVQTAAAQFARAARLRPGNADYALRAARAASMYAGSAEVHRLARAAIAANPRAVAPYRLLADYELSREKPDAALVRRAYESALALDPQNQRLRLAYAQAMEKLK